MPLLPPIKLLALLLAIAATPLAHAEEERVMNAAQADLNAARDIFAKLKARIESARAQGGQASEADLKRYKVLQSNIAAREDSLRRQGKLDPPKVEAKPKAPPRPQPPPPPPPRGPEPKGHSYYERRHFEPEENFPYDRSNLKKPGPEYVWKLEGQYALWNTNEWKGRPINDDVLVPHYMRDTVFIPGHYGIGAYVQTKDPAAPGRKKVLQVLDAISNGMLLAVDKDKKAWILNYRDVELGTNGIGDLKPGEEVRHKSLVKKTQVHTIFADGTTVLYQSDLGPGNGYSSMENVVIAPKDEIKWAPGFFKSCARAFSDIK